MTTLYRPSDTELGKELDELINRMYFEAPREMYEDAAKLAVEIVKLFGDRGLGIGTTALALALALRFNIDVALNRNGKNHDEKLQ